jgi:hypothetical protein
MRMEFARDRLPVSNQPYAVPAFDDVKDPKASVPPIEPLRQPAGAPNVLVFPPDDVGFGASSTFGQPWAAPAVERLEEGGVMRDGFYTTALYASTRQVALEPCHARCDVPERAA